MNKSQTALVRALLSMIGKESAFKAFSNITIEEHRLRFWIDSGNVEVIVSSNDIADTRLRGVIRVATLKQYLPGAGEVSLAVEAGKVKIRPFRGTFTVACDTTDQPLIFSAIETVVAEFVGASDVVEASKAASKDTTRTHINGVWLKGEFARATDGHKLEKRALHGRSTEPVMLPVPVCKVLAKLLPIGSIVVTRGKRGWFAGNADMCELTFSCDGAVVRLAWRDEAGTSGGPPMEAFEENCPKFSIPIDVDRNELKGLVKPFKWPHVSFWPDGAMVVHEASVSDTTEDPIIASYLPNGVPTTDPVWILGPTNLPLPDGEMAVAADKQHCRIGTRIVMGCRSHPHEDGKPFRTDLPISVQEQLALQWGLAERIPVKRSQSEHKLVQMEREIYAERDRIESLKASGDCSKATMNAEIELSKRFAELRRTLRRYELGFRKLEIEEDGGKVGGIVDLSLVTCGRAVLTDRFGGTFWGLTGLRRENQPDGLIRVVDERAGFLYSYRPSAIEKSRPVMDVKAPEKGRMFGDQFDIGHAIGKTTNAKPITVVQPIAETPPVDYVTLKGINHERQTDPMDAGRFRLLQTGRDCRCMCLDSSFRTRGLQSATRGGNCGR